MITIYDYVSKIKHSYNYFTEHRYFIVPVQFKKFLEKSNLTKVTVPLLIETEFLKIFYD